MNYYKTITDKYKTLDDKKKFVTTESFVASVLPLEEFKEKINFGERVKVLGAVWYTVVTNVEKVTVNDYYISLLKKHDWFYMMSDDRRVYQAGLSSYRTLSSFQRLVDSDFTIWNEHAPEEAKKKVE